MIAPNKFTLLSLVLGLIAATSLTNSMALAQDKDTKTTVKHRVFKIQTGNEKPTKIEVDEDGQVQIIELNMEDLKDDALLQSKLMNLDEDTRATVLKVIQQSGKNASNGLAFINTDNKSTFTLDNIQFDEELTKNTEIVVVRADDNVNFKGILKGHHQAVIKLIEKGEFTRDELNAIQKALDAKY
jgi:Fe2+ transport system protein B